VSDFNTPTLTDVADFLETKVLYVALFTTTPTNTTPGTEVTGGSPAYARKAITFTNGSAGQTSGTVTFDVPAGTTVKGTGLYDAATGGNYKGGKSSADEVFSSQNTYQVTITLAAV
jgi:hypothetical protein